MFVLDTDVISQTSPFSAEARGVQDWLLIHQQVSYLSAATLSELHFGAHRMRLRGATRKADLLDRWIAEVLNAFAGRYLAIDEDVAARTGVLMARAESRGYDPGFVDASIAASAEAARFEVVTFNTRHFAAFGVPHRKPEAAR